MQLTITAANRSSSRGAGTASSTHWTLRFLPPFRARATGSPVMVLTTTASPSSSLTPSSRLSQEARLALFSLARAASSSGRYFWENSPCRWAFWSSLLMMTSPVSRWLAFLPSSSFRAASGPSFVGWAANRSATRSRTCLELSLASSSRASKSRLAFRARAAVLRVKTSPVRHSATVSSGWVSSQARASFSMRVCFSD